MIKTNSGIKQPMSKYTRAACETLAGRQSFGKYKFLAAFRIGSCFDEHGGIGRSVFVRSTRIVKSFQCSFWIFTIDQVGHYYNVPATMEILINTSMKQGQYPEDFVLEKNMVRSELEKMDQLAFDRRFKDICDEGVTTNHRESNA